MEFHDCVNRWPTRRTARVPRSSRFAKKWESRARNKLCAEEELVRVVLEARPARIVLPPAKTQGRCCRIPGAMRLLRQADVASITEAASVKIGAFSSPGGIASRPILATLGIRSSLAPSLRFR